MLKTTIGRAIQEAKIFYDSQGRNVLAGDEITLNSSTGVVNKATVSTVFFDEARGQMGLSLSLQNGGKTQIWQNEIYEIPNRIVSNTAEGQARPANFEVLERIPKTATGQLKTTLPGGPEGGTRL